MLLYHGTTASLLPKIIRNGILPRQFSQNSQWEHTIPSREDCVYLTDCYAGYFAQVASKNEDSIAVFEIETDFLDSQLFLPDEDALEQLSRNQDLSFLGEASTMEERTKLLRDNLTDFSHLWPESLEYLGTCAFHGSISISAITRVAIYDTRSNPSMSMAMLDPSISVLNHRICAEKYKAMTRWLFNDKFDLEDICGFGTAVVPAELRDRINSMTQQTSGRKVYTFAEMFAGVPTETTKSKGR
jgi:hypothetical protein